MEEARPKPSSPGSRVSGDADEQGRVFARIALLVALAMKPPTPPPQFMCTPSGCVGPTTMSAPYSAGLASTPSEIGSTPTMVSRAMPMREPAIAAALVLDHAEIGRDLDIDGGRLAEILRSRSARSSTASRGS